MLLLRSSVLVFGTQQRIPHGILKIQKHFFNQATCRYFPWNALPLLPAFSLASCRKVSHLLLLSPTRRHPQFSMLFCSKKPATTQGKWRHYSVFNFNPSRTGEKCLEYAPFFPELEKQVNRTGYSALFFGFFRMRSIDSSFLYSWSFV